MHLLFPVRPSIIIILHTLTTDIDIISPRHQFLLTQRSKNKQHVTNNNTISYSNFSTNGTFFLQPFGSWDQWSSHTFHHLQESCTWADLCFLYYITCFVYIPNIITFCNRKHKKKEWIPTVRSHSLFFFSLNIMIIISLYIGTSSLSKVSS